MKYKDIDSQYLSFYPYYARSGQDKFLNELVFKNQKNGVFVDIGAYDGVESSNTLFFEESLSWKGICAEPLFKTFQKLRKNRNCICINKCVANFKGKSSFIHVDPDICPPSKTDPKRTSNYEKMSGLVKFYNENHMKIVDEILDSWGGQKNVLEVECEDINNILEMIKTKNIDILSIDTEGSELAILKHINFNKYEIKTIIVEALYDKNDILRILKQEGYEKIGEMGYDWIFQKKQNFSTVCFT